MYHQIPDSSSAQPFQVSQPVTVAPVVIQTDVGQGSTDVTARDKDSGTAQAMPLGISEGSKDTLQKTEPWPLSFLSGYWINVPVQEVQGIQEQESIGEDSVPLMQDLEPVDRPLFKTLVPTHLLNPSTPVTLRPSGTGEEPQPQQQERDMVSSQKQQQLFFIVEQPVAVSSDEIQVVDTHASLPIPTTDPPTIGLQSFTPVPSEPQNFPKSTGPTNAAAAIRFHAPVTVSPEPPLHLPDDNSTSRISGASTAGHVDDGDDPFFRRSQDRSPGYNLAGLHWLIYLAFQGILTFLLIMLFLGVLILTEYVLDREDEDLENLTALFWARVIGIASATIASAAHGSLLSGYVLLDGTSDWIAKATVGMICGYWGSMVWIMNCVAGPLPY
ncbi:hypothetical protein BGZ54_002273 [Gamsiella multidivaricata]|nr:hypothetical protein BGZ54_002273 [Gamsiella multidivaricata]